VRQLLLRLLQEPKKIQIIFESEFSHVWLSKLLLWITTNPTYQRRESAAFVLKLGYGYVVEPHGKDALVDLAEMALQEFAIAYTPGSWLVDVIPACRCSNRD
jgi:hypothetical protein